LKNEGEGLKRGIWSAPGVAGGIWRCLGEDQDGAIWDLVRLPGALKSLCSKADVFPAVLLRTIIVRWLQSNNDTWQLVGVSTYYNFLLKQFKFEVGYSTALLW